MTVSKAGDLIPRGFTSCDRKIILPATNMAGELKVETKFLGNVGGEVSMSYNWRITDPILFMQSAKSLLSADADGDSKVDPNALEEIESSVMDKVLGDIMREYTPNKKPAIGSLDVEKDLYGLIASKASGRGVEFSNISLNIYFSDQMEEALDVAAALNFYKEIGELELGRKVIEAKAGAPHITTVVKNEIPINKED